MTQLIKRLSIVASIALFPSLGFAQEAPIPTAKPGVVSAQDANYVLERRALKVKRIDVEKRYTEAVETFKRETAELATAKAASDKTGLKAALIEYKTAKSNLRSVRSELKAVQKQWFALTKKA